MALPARHEQGPMRAPPPSSNPAVHVHIEWRAPLASNCLVPWSAAPRLVRQHECHLPPVPLHRDICPERAGTFWRRFLGALLEARTFNAPDGLFACSTHPLAPSSLSPHPGREVLSACSRPASRGRLSHLVVPVPRLGTTGEDWCLLIRLLPPLVGGSPGTPIALAVS